MATLTQDDYDGIAAALIKAQRGTEASDAWPRCPKCNGKQVVNGCDGRTQNPFNCPACDAAKLAEDRSAALAAAEPKVVEP